MSGAVNAVVVSKPPVDEVSSGASVLSDPDSVLLSFSLMVSLFC